MLRSLSTRAVFVHLYPPVHLTQDESWTECDLLREQKYEASMKCYQSRPVINNKILHGSVTAGCGGKVGFTASQGRASKQSKS